MGWLKQLRIDWGIGGAIGIVREIGSKLMYCIDDILLVLEEIDRLKKDLSNAIE